MLTYIYKEQFKSAYHDFDKMISIGQKYDELIIDQMRRGKMEMKKAFELHEIVLKKIRYYIMRDIDMFADDFKKLPVWEYDK